MTDHVWVQEHVAAYLAGGLDAQEAERLEAHARECSVCEQTLVEARQLDAGLRALFADAQPDLALTDRVVARLRTGPALRWPTFSRRAKWAAAIAAVVLLGVIGAVVDSPVSNDRRVALYEKESPGGGTRQQANQDLTNEDSGLDSKIEAALPGIERSDKNAVDNNETTASIRRPNSPNTNINGYAPPGFFTHNGGTPPPSPYLFSFDPSKSYVKELKLKPPAAQPGDVFMPEKPDPAPQPKAPDPPNPQPNPEPQKRIIIRSGDMEFEVESFDAATATISKLVLGIKGAFIVTVNSDKLANGKVKGSITVRVPPEQLDGLVLDLRRELSKGGELKGVKLTSQDITKTYTDLESRLRAARTMEQRLLQIIKEGKGEIKQLLEAEKELGVWRTKIEELEGEIRYYANLVSFSTLTITLTEKEIRAAATITEQERVQAGVEVEDVDKAYQQLLAAVMEAKGRITKSELKQVSAGQFNAIFQFEVAADSSGPIRDRLRMLGRVARLEIDRSVQTQGGTLPSDAKTKRGDTIFLIQLYNLANVAPRETVTLQVAAVDVSAAYQALRDAVTKTTGRVLVAQLNKVDRQNVSAELHFEVRRTEEGAIQTALGTMGDTLSRQVNRAAESDSVTDSKVLYKLTFYSAHQLKPRETTAMTVEVQDVDGSVTLLTAEAVKVEGRQVDAKFDRDAAGQSTAKLVFEVPLAASVGLVERFKSAGTVRLSQSVRDPQANEGKLATARIIVTLTNAEAIVPEGDGLWSKVRKGLSISASVLLVSVTCVIVGLCVVLPWAVIGLGGYRVVRRFVRSAPALVATPAPSSPTPPATPPAA